MTKTTNTPIGTLYTERIWDTLHVTNDPKVIEAVRKKALRDGHTISHDDGTTEHHNVTEDHPMVWDKSGERTRHTVTRVIKRDGEIISESDIRTTYRKPTEW